METAIERRLRDSACGILLVLAAVLYAGRYWLHLDRFVSGYLDEAGPCQDSRGSLMAEAGSAEAFGQTGA